MHFLTQRVVRAYRLKQAGIFAPPPRMVEEIFTWVWEQIRGIALGKLDKEIDAIYTEVSRLQKPQELAEKFNQITNILLNLKPHALILRKIVNTIQDPRIRKQLDQLVDYVVVKNELIGQGIEPIPYWKDSVQKEFDKDLRGWKYEPPAEDLEYVTDFPLHVYVYNGLIGYVAQINVGSNSLRVYFVGVPRDLRDLKRMESIYKDTIVHELMHFGQEILKEVARRKAYNEERAKLESIEDVKARWEALDKVPPVYKQPAPDYGMPSRRMQDKVKQSFFNFEADENYFLDDREFQTWLRSSSQVLSELLNSMPGRYHKAAFRFFAIGDSMPRELAEYIETYNFKEMFGSVYEFFMQLRAHNPDKYQRAVREVYKELVRLGADF